MLVGFGPQLQAESSLKLKSSVRMFDLLEHRKQLERMLPVTYHCWHQSHCQRPPSVDFVIRRKRTQATVAAPPPFVVQSTILLDERGYLRPPQHEKQFVLPFLRRFAKIAHPTERTFFSYQFYQKSRESLSNTKEKRYRYKHHTWTAVTAARLLSPTQAAEDVAAVFKDCNTCWSWMLVAALDATSCAFPHHPESASPTEPVHPANSCEEAPKVPEERMFEEDTEVLIRMRKQQWRCLNITAQINPCCY